MSGAFATRLNEVDLDEEQKLFFEKLDEMRKMMELAEISYILGQDIVRLDNDITESLKTIDKKIAELGGDDPNLKALQDDRRQLEEAKSDLEKVDQDRTQAKDKSDLKNARTKLENLEDRIRTPLERHEQDTPFNFEADQERRQPTGKSGRRAAPAPEPEVKPAPPPEPDE